MLIFGLHLTSDDWPSDPNNESCPKCEKMAAKLSKNEMPILGLCSTSDDQLGWPMDSNPICHFTLTPKTEMLIFGLYSTSDDWPSDPSDESHLKCRKMAAELSKNEMFILGLSSTSNNWLHDPTGESHPKCKKMATKLSKDEMLIFGLCSTSAD